MMNATYNDYAATYPDKLTEEQFAAILPSANAYIKVITHDRCETAAGYKLERAKLALFAVMNEMHAQQSLCNASGARLQSVSNDGYSEHYGSSDGSCIKRAALEWLSGTGLVSAL